MHRNAPTTLVDSPAEDTQSNGRVENAIKKVRNIVKTQFFQVWNQKGASEWFVTTHSSLGV